MRLAYESQRHRQRIMFEPFEKWLERHVEEKLAIPKFIAHDVALLSKPPAPTVYEYLAMWTYGNHYRCEEWVWGTMHKSYDSGVASVIR
jgi:hypothetical protein